MVLSSCKHLQRSSRHQGGLAPSRQPRCWPVRVPATQEQKKQLRQLAGAQLCRAAAVEVQPEAAVSGMTAYLDTLRWSKDGLVPVIVQVRAYVLTRYACSYECSLMQAAT